MNFIRFVQEQAGENTQKIGAAIIASGIFQGLSLLVISMAIDELASKDPSFHLLILFILCLSAYYLTYKYAASTISVSAQKNVANMQTNMADALRKLDLRRYEQLDQGLVYQTVTGNKDILVEASRGLITGLSCLTMTSVALLLAAYISMPGFITVITVMTLCCFLLGAMQRDVVKQQEEIQALDQSFVQSLNDLLHGFPELKMNQARNDALYIDVIHRRAVECSNAKAAVEGQMVQGMAFFTSFAFFPVAFVLFILPEFIDLSLEEAIKVIGITLFVLTPITGTVFLIPVLAKAQMTLNSITTFQDALRSIPEPPATTMDAPEFSSLTMTDVEFSYVNTTGDEFFRIEVPSFQLRKGEILFLRGGNGGGKTSFMKILAGLYRPQRGCITVNGRPLEEIGPQDYRHFFSLILSNFHLFERLYGMPEVQEKEVRELLGMMRLDHKVSFDTQKGFSTRELSSGQKKRLAVVVACLENRPVMLFDEVAADFDPQFRTFFYREFLPMLQRQGKTIVAISHDDRYFDVADRILELQYGRIVSEQVRNMESPA